jgi:hypothetical protein
VVQFVKNESSEKPSEKLIIFEVTQYGAVQSFEKNLPWHSKTEMIAW